MQDVEWARFAGTIAAVGNIDHADVTRESRLVEDLGLDSLAMFEVVVAVHVDFGVADLPERFQREAWLGVTAGALFDECVVAGSRPPRLQWGPGSAPGTATA